MHNLLLENITNFGRIEWCKAREKLKKLDACQNWIVANFDKWQTLNRIFCA